MNKMIHFYDNTGVKRFIALGQIITMCQACYFKGKELEYDEIIFEWHNMVTYPFWNDDSKLMGILDCPKHNILPFFFVPKNSKILKKSKGMDISKPNVLYEGSSPLLSNPMNMEPYLNFLNKYYLDHNEYPRIEIKPSNDKYILFHYRKSEQARQLVRNTIDEDFEKLYEYIREVSDYKLIKFGEKSRIDDKFDESYTYLNDIGDLFSLVNNSTLFIASTSGPLHIAYMLGKPSIVSIDDTTKKTYKEGEWKGDKDVTYGKSGYDWLDKERYYFIMNGETNVIDSKEDIIKFMEKYI